MAKKIPQNFCALPEEYSSPEKSEIAILPVPFGKTSSWLRGTEKGPRAIIRASQNMELYDIETDSEVCEKGIFTEKEIKPTTSEEMVGKVYKKTKELLKKEKFVVVLGGEHSVSIGAIKAHAEKFPALGVLHLDAHSDRRDSYEGSRLNHACTIARAQEIAGNIVSVGVRSMDSCEKQNVKNSRIFFAHEIMESKNWIEEAVGALPENVYVTIDLDVFDSGIMPSVGTPEPGGLGWYQVIGLLKKVMEKKNLAGFDVVELCPNKNNKAPDFLAAKLVYRLLSEKFFGKRI